MIERGTFQASPPLVGPGFEAQAIVSRLVRLPHSFLPEDVGDPFIETQNPLQIRQALLSDPRFLALSSRGPEYFISRHSLDRWFVWLNCRLASAGICSLPWEKVVAVASGLNPQGRWHSLKSDFITSPGRLGLAFYSTDRNRVNFPLARLLSYLTGSILDEAKDILIEMLNRGTRTKCLQEETVYELFLALPGRVATIIRQREGLEDGRKRTLQEVGVGLGITRERVRQIEKRFWAGLRSGPPKLVGGIRPGDCLRYLAAYYLQFGGRLVVSRQSGIRSTLLFACRCLDLPVCDVPDTDLAVLGNETLPDRRFCRNEVLFLDGDTLRDELAAEHGLCGEYDEMTRLVDWVLSRRNRSMSKIDRVCFVLAKLGKPSHYSEVAREYNRMFPDAPSTEHNIHAVLSREQRGIVWVGVRGTFALRKWGYERPAKGLCESVEEIVRKHYEKTGRPVPYQVVQAEIGKYRQIVNPNSLYMAAFLNKNLSYTGSSLMPREDEANPVAESLPENRVVDQILAAFEKTLVQKQRNRSQNP